MAISGEPLLVFAPLRPEALAVRAPGLRVVRSGMGREQSLRAAACGASGMAVAGVCGAVAPELEAGDVVLASELRAADREPLPVPGSALLAAALRRRGLRVSVGPIASVERIASPAERSRLAADGVLAVDMESAWLADAVDGGPLAVLRVVVEAADRPLLRPRTAVAGVRALAALRRSRGALEEWAGAIRPRRVVLAAPRSFSAGVDRALEIARDSDVVLVAGSQASSSSLRLVEIAGRQGTPAHLVGDPAQVDVAWLAGAATVGVSVDASAPEQLVRDLLAALGALGGVEVEEPTIRLPREVARA